MAKGRAEVAVYSFPTDEDALVFNPFTGKFEGYAQTCDELTKLTPSGRYYGFQINNRHFTRDKGEARAVLGCSEGT